MNPLEIRVGTWQFWMLLGGLVVGSVLVAESSAAVTRRRLRRRYR